MFEVNQMILFIRKKVFLILSALALFFASQNVYAASIPSEPVESFIGNCYYDSVFNLRLSNTTPDICAAAIRSAYDYLSLTWTYFGGQGQHYQMRSGSSLYGKLTITKVVQSYQCTNPDYPNLSEDESSCDNGVFTPTESQETDLAALMADVGDLNDTTKDLFIELEDSKNTVKDDFNSALNNAAVGVGAVNALNDQVDVVDAFIPLNPESTLLPALSNSMSNNVLSAEELSTDNMNVVDSMITMNNDAVALFNDTSEIVGFNQDGVNYIYGQNEQLYTASNETEYNQTLDNIRNKQNEIENNNSLIQSNQDSINTIVSNSGNAVDKVKENNSNIQTIVTENNNYYSQATNSANNGEVCAGSECAAIPDLEDPDEDEDAQKSNLPTHRDNAPYESFEDGFTAYYDSINDSPIAKSFSAFSNIIVVPQGTCPVLSIDLSATPIGVIDTDIHCKIFIQIATPLSLIMHVVFLFGGFRIVAGA